MYGSSKGAFGMQLYRFQVAAKVTVRVAPQTLDGHNFLVRTLIRMSLDSIERHLSLESIHI